MLFSVAEAAREACLRISEILQAIEEEELETTEGPDGEALIEGNDLVQFIQSLRSNDDQDE